MTAPSDMGGRSEFFGPVIQESDEPVFHERWEGRVFGISNFLLPLLGRNTDILRFAFERQPREVYLSSYYERWLGGFEDLLVAAGYLAPGEVTRQPGYVTGKPGVIVAHLGATVFPDAKTVGRHALPQHQYTVAFQGDDLWGDAAEPGTEVRVDLFESYLEAI